MVTKGKGNPDEVALDMSAVKPFEALDESPVYLTTVTNLDLGKAKSSNKQVSNLELTIDGPEEVAGIETLFDDDGKASPGGPIVDKDGNPVTVTAKGRKLFRTFTLEEKALPFLHEFVRAVDPGTELGADFIYSPKNYMGMQCAVKIKNEGYEEQVRARVQRILPASAYKG